MAEHAMVLDAIPSAEIAFRHGDSGISQFCHEPGNRGGTFSEDLRIGDLGSDMTVNPPDLDSWKGDRLKKHPAGVAVRNPELVLLPAGRDIRMSAGVDVEI